MNEAVRQYRAQRILSREPEAHYRIPVVVHVIHRGEEIGFGSNISEAQFVDQLRILNEDFGRQNADTSNTRGLFRQVAADPDIEFVLARQDPDGLPTSGVVRLPGTRLSYSLRDENELGRISQWSADHYLNIWVAPLRNNAGGSLLGFVPESSIPGWNNQFSNPVVDGVVIDYRNFGSLGELRSSANRGRTTTHEVGHFLGLYHIWGDGGCDREDFVDDTPPQAKSSVGCPPDTANSCGSLDMYENFMDYTDNGCMNMFTQGQKDRMRAVLTMISRRSSLLTSPALDQPALMTDEATISQVISPFLGICPEAQPIPTIAVANVGVNAINDITIAFRVEDTLIEIEEVMFPVSLAAGSSSELTFAPLPKQWLPAPGQSCQASFTITRINGIEKSPADEYARYS